MDILDPVPSTGSFLFVRRRTGRRVSLLIMQRVMDVNVEMVSRRGGEASSLVAPPVVRRRHRDGLGWCAANPFHRLDHVPAPRVAAVHPHGRTQRLCTTTTRRPVEFSVAFDDLMADGGAVVFDSRPGQPRRSTVWASNPGSHHHQLYVRH
jgi:hypothetical protein